MISIASSTTKLALPLAVIVMIFLPVTAHPWVESRCMNYYCIHSIVVVNQLSGSLSTINQSINQSMSVGCCCGTLLLEVATGRSQQSSGEGAAVLLLSAPAALPSTGIKKGLGRCPSCRVSSTGSK